MSVSSADRASSCGTSKCSPSALDATTDSRTKAKQCNTYSRSCVRSRPRSSVNFCNSWRVVRDCPWAVSVRSCPRSLSCEKPSTRPIYRAQARQRPIQRTTCRRWWLASTISSCPTTRAWSPCEKSCSRPWATDNCPFTCHKILTKRSWRKLEEENIFRLYYIIITIFFLLDSFFCALLTYLIKINYRYIFKTLIYKKNLALKIGKKKH